MYDALQPVAQAQPLVEARHVVYQRQLGACGLVPIISNSQTSATQQFALTENSLFNNGDSCDLANKIDYWIEHEEDKEKYSKLYAESAKKYSIESSIAKFEEMLNTAIEENKAKK